MGYFVIKKDEKEKYVLDEYEEVFAFEENALEILAKAEHARWVAERVMNGWTYGETRDNIFKIHPNITTWENLKPSVQDYDYAFVKNIIPSLNKAGFKVLKHKSK